jgi:hypothetical protein
MQCKELEAVLESEGLDSLPSEAREHLAGCTCCQDLFADLSAVVTAAKTLPAEVAPPDRIWVSIRAQLEREGIIRDAEPVVIAPAASWWQGFSELFRPRTLATVGASLFVILGSVYLVKHRNPVAVPKSPPVQAQAKVDSVVTPPVSIATEEKPQIPVGNPEVTHQANKVGFRPSTTDLKASPSEDIYLGQSASVLDQTESSLPRQELANNAAVDAALRKNLRTLNEFIAECQARLKQNPDDQLTREYLNMAYQQKAELLTAMLDSGRSEH